MTAESPSPVAFSELGLPDAMLAVLSRIGYETPSPIQAQTIPLLLEGRDVLGQAQTGTGKTAAFALPILARLDLLSKATQVLVLAPTRELAIQVAEAFQTYASYIPNFHVLPIYGGASYTGQLRQLKQGAQVVVGTPGRVMDHMRRGTLDLSRLQCLVLDEADEMLRMGFIDDVEWILEQTPEERQIALFSATMPREIRRIAQTHLNEPAEVTIAVKTTTASTIRQRYWAVSGMHKLDALTRMLEVEDFDGMIIFVRTKTATVELSDKLRARGYNAAPLNGDIVQSQREHTITQLKNGELDIVVATDVAARGLDVERVSHVINYDIPTDTEAYVHRIGRTGRAGRSGDAILFVAPREKRLLFAIEKATRQPIELMELPSAKLINDKRISRFKQRITDMLEKQDLDLDFYRDLIAQYQHEYGTELEHIAAALAALVQGDAKMLLDEKDMPAAMPLADERPRKRDKHQGDDDRNPRNKRPRGDKPLRELEAGMERYRLDVGYAHNVKPGNIVGAIANEADLDSKFIGHIAIHDDHSTVDLPAGMPDDVLQLLKKTRVAGRPMNLSRVSGQSGAERATDNSPFKPATQRKPLSRKAPATDAGAHDRKPRSNKTHSDKPRSNKPQGDTIRSDKPRGDKPREVNGNSVDYVPPKPPSNKKPFRKSPGVPVKSGYSHPGYQDLSSLSRPRPAGSPAGGRKPAHPGGTGNKPAGNPSSTKPFRKK